jgi:hypothetical protein
MKQRDDPRRDRLPAGAVEALVRSTAARPELAEAALANETVRDLMARHPGL